jgi:hypothetical protein
VCVLHRFCVFATDFFFVCGWVGSATHTNTSAIHTNSQFGAQNH